MNPGRLIAPIYPRVFKSIAFVIVCLFVLTLLAQAAPPVDGGGTIGIGESIIGDLDLGETDTWTFLGQAGQRITIAVERSHLSDIDPALELYSPDSTLIASDDDSGPGLDAILPGIVLPTDGLYSARVINNGTGGLYQLTLAENILPGGCETLVGEIVTTEWYSSVANETLRYRVYLPPCHEYTNHRYPYIILMHGSASTDSHWDDLGMDEAATLGVSLNRLPPLALVMPYGGEIANLNIFYIDGSYEYVIRNEVIPMVERAFCLQTTGEGRAIGGISRGGFWAYEIGLKNPELFVAIGGHSPVFDLTHAPPTNNPLNLAENFEWTDDSPRLYIDRGEDDYWQTNIDLMPPRLEASGILFTFVVADGGTHSDAYWAAHLTDYLAFYSEDWMDGLETYPLCDSQTPSSS